MLTEEMAKVEMSTGLCAVCSWCEHWHDAKDKWSTMSCPKECGGPASNPPRAFPMYKGPWQNNLSKMCFICGKNADAGVEIVNKGFVGICDKHISTFKQILYDKTGKYPIISERYAFAPKEKKD